MVENNKFLNGKIYKLTDNENTKCYIGSTIVPLSERMGRHKSDFKKFLETQKRFGSFDLQGEPKKSRTGFVSSFIIFSEFGAENCKIELLYDYPCESLKELRQKEGEYIKLIDCVNKNVAGQTIKEWCVQNRDRLKEYQKEWCEQNKERVREYQKEYKQQNQDKLKHYQKEYHKEHRKKHGKPQKERKEKLKPNKKQRKRYIVRVIKYAPLTGSL